MSTWRRQRQLSRLLTLPRTVACAAAALLVASIASSALADDPYALTLVSSQQLDDRMFDLVFRPESSCRPTMRPTRRGAIPSSTSSMDAARITGPGPTWERSRSRTGFH